MEDDWMTETMRLCSVVIRPAPCVLVAAYMRFCGTHHSFLMMPCGGVLRFPLTETDFSAVFDVATRTDARAYVFVLEPC